MRATIRHIKEETSNIKTFWFSPERPVQYNAGQYIELAILHQSADHRGEKRWFTLSSSPTEDLLAITTKISGIPAHLTFRQGGSQAAVAVGSGSSRGVPERYEAGGHELAGAGDRGSDPKRQARRGTRRSSSSFKQALNSLSVGDDIEISQPLGDFVLPISPSIPIIFVAAGIGITPMRSMAKWLSDTGQKRDMRLFYAVNKLNEAVFLDIFQESQTEVTIVPTNPPKNWKGQPGPLSPDYILAETPDNNSGLHYFYISGPETLVESLTLGLKKRGVRSEQIVTDYFHGYTSV